MLVPNKYGPSDYTDQKAGWLCQLTAPHGVFTLTASAALLSWLWYHRSEAADCVQQLAPQAVGPALKEKLLTGVLAQVNSQMHLASIPLISALIYPASRQVQNGGH